MHKIIYHFKDGNTLVEYRRTVNIKKYIENVLKNEYYDDDKGRIINTKNIDYISYD